jgi:adenylate cyclase
MVAGRVPFEADTSLSVALKHKTERPIDPRKINAKVSEGLSGMILKCLEKAADRRYQTAEELLAALEKLEKGTVETVEVEPPVPGFLTEEGEPAEPEKPVFVGRKDELGKLESFLKKVLAGNGQVTFVKGEAGSGKTALVQEFARRAQKTHPDLIVVSGKCNAHTGIGDPYLPFIETLSLLTGDVEIKWSAGVISKEHALRLWNLIPDSVKALLKDGQDLIKTFIPGEALVSRCESFASGLPEWLTGIEKLVEQKAALPVDPMLQQSNLFEQYAKVLETLATKHPLLLILDDLQWTDAGSASLLFHLGRRIKSSPILILGAYRPEEVALGREEKRHPLEPVINELKLDFGELEIVLGEADEQQFVEDFLDSEPNKLGKEFRETFFRQTKGHPLFTVELLRGMEEQGLLVKDKENRWVEGPGLNWDALPVRVDAVIEERISRLTGKLHDVLTLASVEGEEFTAEVVARLQETEVRDLIRLLSHELDKRHHLVSAKGIKRLEKQRLSLYFFQHILFQRYLYNGLDEVERSHLHEEVGNILESLYGDEADEISVQLASHFGEAGVTEKAVEYLQKAGAKAVQLSANEEAIAHFNKCIELLMSLPDTPERNQQELMLQISLPAPLIATRGYGAPEVGRALKRARELCDKFGETPQLFTALSLLVMFYALKAEYRTAIELGEQTNRIADKEDDSFLRSVSYSILGWPLINVAEFEKSLDYMNYVIERYDPEKFFPWTFIVGQDVGQIAYTWKSLLLWFFGYPDQALKSSLEAISLARKLGHPHTLAFGLTIGCIFHWFIRDYKTVRKYTEELIPLSSDGGFIFWWAHGIFYQGERKTQEGQVDEGIKQMHEGLETMLATGTETCMTRLRARLAEACLKVKRPEEGLSAIDQTFDVLCRHDEIYFEAELHRLKGELLLMQGKTESEVEACYQKAIEVSRSQKAKSLELRAAMSLSRLWQKQGKKDDALKLLKEIYGWFTEGFNTGDLKEAKALLDDMSSGK